MQKNYAVLGLGANLGDRAANLLRAVTALMQRGLTITRASDIYQTDPVDYLDQPAFLNMCLLLSGDNLPPPLALLSLCLQIEAELGRERLIARGPRTIDIDLLLYRDLIIDHQSKDQIKSGSDLGSDQRSNEIDPGSDLRSDRDLISDQNSDQGSDRFAANRISLIVPHPRLHQRRFVLVPLVELLGDEQHPQWQISYRELLHRLPDQDMVCRYQD